MVQLKEAFAFKSIRSWLSFNSSMVQLKEAFAITVVAVILFQFLYGTIKSGIKLNAEMPS